MIPLLLFHSLIFVFVDSFVDFVFLIAFVVERMLSMVVAAAAAAAAATYPVACLVAVACVAYVACVACVAYVEVSSYVVVKQLGVEDNREVKAYPISMLGRVATN